MRVASTQTSIKASCHPRTTALRRSVSDLVARKMSSFTRLSVVNRHRRTTLAPSAIKKRASSLRALQRTLAMTLVRASILMSQCNNPLPAPPKSCAHSKTKKKPTRAPTRYPNPTTKYQERFPSNSTRKTPSTHV